ncbi:IFN-alpha/beta binding protein [Ectromelia virus]|uniref:Soluble interferon alpha/beta receptor OPG204 n=2 Tax=Ectromelia virus TaxID=12643 RepID=A0A8D9FU04_9POXV|nr:IFN-alpha/beta binding protein C12R [Ectromelia virus]AAC99571.1 IFN-alpha/beta binding protein C12R [Ectromelia virus]AAX23681.1 soluble interferon-alpha/beta receptor [Ectromelia virus]AAX23682.1 soluble interferon-alpha/beta receptor [Ectromelia virus]AUO16329.1 IFN-alpha/beta binding protein [Ectromelia virus]CAC41986.1 interferon alpha/beta receptor [Ectromelia virus]
MMKMTMKMMVRIYFVSLSLSLSLLLFHSYAIDIENEITEFFNKMRDTLPAKDSKWLNPSCMFGGTMNDMAALGEPFSAKCPPIEDSLLSHRYNDKDNVVNWEKIGKTRRPLNRRVKNGDLWIANYTSNDSHRRYLCTVTTKNGDCVQGIVRSHIRKPPSCIPETYELGTHDKYGIDLYCGILYAKHYNNITWYKNNQELIIDGTKYSQSGQNLIIHNPELEDSGRYDCYVHYDDVRIKNDIVVSRCKILTVIPSQDHRFKLILDPKINVTIGEPANITCTAVSTSLLVDDVLIDWENPSGWIIGLDFGVYSILTSSGGITEATLYFENVTEEYIGNTYTCRGHNYYFDKTLTTTVVLE